MVTKEQMQRLNRVRQSLESERERYDNVWKEIARYVAPFYGNWGDSSPKDEGLASTKDIYDNVAIRASNRLADGIQGYAFGRSISWFRLAFETEELNDNQTYTKWLQDVEKILYKRLNKSNFYDEGRAFIKCGADFGTAIMLRENNVKRSLPCYRTLHPKNALIQENSFGEVDTLFRLFWLSTEDAKDYFSKGILSKTITECKEHTKLWRFWQYIGPSGRYSLDVPGTQDFISVFWSDVDPDTTITEERLDYKPFFAWRWARSYIGDVWGVDSPGLNEIPNIRQLNSMAKDKLRNSQLTARPPIKKTEGLAVNFVPGGMIDIRSGQDFAVQSITGDLKWLEFDIEKMRKYIEESYYSDFFLLLTQNIERMKTATEVAGLQDEKSALLAAFFGRLSVEFLEPVLEDLVDSEIEYQRLPKPPEGLADSDLAIDFISPLAMMQKQAHELTTTRSFMSQALQIGELVPSALDKVDFDEYLELMSDSMNVNRRIIKPKADVDKIRKARAELQAQQLQQQQMVEQAKASADIMAKGGKAPEKGSMVEQKMR